jgi:hypothetical protein
MNPPRPKTIFGGHSKPNLGQRATRRRKLGGLRHERPQVLRVLCVRSSAHRKISSNFTRRSANNSLWTASRERASSWSRPLWLVIRGPTSAEVVDLWPVCRNAGWKNYESSPDLDPKRFESSLVKVFGSWAGFGVFLDLKSILREYGGE